MENENNQNPVEGGLKKGNVETYTGDMVKILEGDKSGLIKKIITEQEKHEAEDKNLSPESAKNRIFLMVSITLVLTALAALITLVLFKKEITTVPVSVQFSSMIVTDKIHFNALDGLNKEAIFQTVLNEIENTEVKEGGVEGIYFTEKDQIVGFKRFISLIKANLSEEEMGVVNDTFMLGVVKKGKADLFVLLDVRSFTDIFPVMKNWEPKMFSNLHRVFDETLSSETAYLLTKDFTDGIVNNKSARILYDKSNNIVMMYVFADENSVIITDSPAAAAEVTLRLAASKVKK